MRTRLIRAILIGAGLVGGLGLGGQTLLERLTSPHPEERDQAKEEVLLQRNLVIQAMVELLEEKGEQKEQWGPGATQVKTAVHLLGELRQPWAVDPLIRHLNAGHVPGEDIIAHELAPNPVGVALVKIGKPSVPAVLAALRSTEDRYMRWQCSLILKGVEGKEVGRFILEKAIEREEDPQKRANLERALPFFRAAKEQDE